MVSVRLFVKKNIFSTGLTHSLLPCLEGILPALKYTFRVRGRKRAWGRWWCEWARVHKDLGLVEIILVIVPSIWS